MIEVSLREGVLSVHSLKGKKEISSIVEESVKILQEARTIFVDPVTGEITLNENGPRNGFRKIAECYRQLQEESLEAYSQKDAERAAIIAFRLLRMPVEDIRKNHLVTLFLKIFGDEPRVIWKIEEIRDAIDADRAMSICDISPSLEYLEAEMALFAFLSRWEPTEAVPLGFVRKAYAVIFFNLVGYEEREVARAFEFLCEAKILSKDIESEEERYAFQGYALLGKHNILNKKIQLILDRENF